MEYLLSKLVGHIAEAMPEISLVDEDYGQLEALDQSDRDMYPLTTLKNTHLSDIFHTYTHIKTQ